MAMARTGPGMIPTIQQKAAGSATTQALDALQRMADQSNGVKSAQNQGKTGGVNKHSPPAAINPGAGAQPVQRVEYTVTRDIALEKGIKTFETTPFKAATKRKAATPEKTAKTKAKGEFYAALRSEYPVPDKASDLEFEQQEQARGRDYLLRKKMIDHEFDKVDDDAETVDVYRPSITADTSDAKRSGGTQAKDVSKLTGAKYLGAHLVKREWGGEDNMWNVVAWPKASAEDKWARDFESPIDKAGLWGLDPGTISISVTKEDDLIPKMRLDRMIEGAVRKMPGDDDAKSAAIRRSLDPHFMDPVDTQRHFANRAVESVPIEARGVARAPDIKTGEVNQSTTTLDSAETAYTVATTKAVEAVRAKIDDEIIKTSEMDVIADEKRHPRARAPQTLRKTDSRETEKRHDERAKDWENELEAYDDGFETKNDLV